MKDQKILTDQLKLMAKKLVEESERMPEEPLIVNYDNGGGQSGVRENPYFPAYEKLLASYIKALTALKSTAENNSSEVLSLDAIRSKIRVAK